MIKKTVEAYTNSEWDSVNTCYIEINDDRIAAVRKAQRLIAQYPEFSNIEITAPDYEFVVIDEDTQEVSSPEQTIRYGKFRVSRYDVIYVAYGKHSMEEFFTDDISELFKIN